MFDRITSSPRALRLLAATFSHSRFLSDEVLRVPEWIEQLAATGEINRVLSAEEYETRLTRYLAEHCKTVSVAVALARFRRRKILRIMLRDVLGLATLSDVAEELSNLADAILELAYRTVRTELVAQHGAPRFTSETGDLRECGFAVIALGKLGGKELNYSSDIDLMFVYSGNGDTDGGDSISNKEFFKKLANRYTTLLSTYTPQGLCYRVDLRLRPDGRLGELCLSLDGMKDYYANRARDWELQMMIKARVAAGDRKLGRRLIGFVEPLTYRSTLDFRAIEAVSEARQRIGEKLAARQAAQSLSAGGTIDVKLSPGGIRDIEFLVQCLQRLHGGREPWVRHGGTLFALFRLRDKDLLSGAEYSRLASAYQFLRTVEHRLQFEDDRQTHALPHDGTAVETLARKIPPGADGEPFTAERLVVKVNAYLADVREIYERVIHANRPAYHAYYSFKPQEEVQQEAAVEPAQESTPDPPPSNLIRFLDQKAPGLAAALVRRRLLRGRERFEPFLEKVVASPELLAFLDGNSEVADCTIELFEHSQHYSDTLSRHPEMVRALDIAQPWSIGNVPLDAQDLRRFFHRQMLRIQAESILRAEPIFDTLARTSQLADAIIRAAYRIALARRPPSALTSRSYQPGSQLMVVALGRLGMGEFDVASDADLVFVLPDEDAAELEFWTGVASGIIDVVSAYTGAGAMFAVDTRLRPNGREGALVQTESSFRDYFATRAEAWEGIAYMKSRGIAGDLARAEEFLSTLQQVDWRRYGQSGRSRAELAQMRARLEKEQGEKNPLKAGRGGYYDIDFALMYLRLKSAGIYYKFLNTPQRIDVVEKMGHLEREDAAFLLDAATFYRALDHGLRVKTGQSTGTLPAAQAKMDSLTALVARWLPGQYREGPLQERLRQIQNRTRRYFDRLFG
ncbi:MAG: glutamine-synthetase adenylyltransferase [Bryobacterales bacterium]|nr:glutamine-synthetase adenylyltransferase [Bryobacterales bacterium]